MSTNLPDIFSDDRELTRDDFNDREALAKATGQSQGDAEFSNVPQLKINADHDDEHGNVLVAGAFEVMLPDGMRVFGEEVNFRILFRTYQYTHFDPDVGDNGEVVNRTIHSPTLMGNLPDEKGGSKCGKLSKKQVEKAGEDGLTAAQVKIQKEVACKQSIWGLVSFTGKSATTPEGEGGETVEVKDYAVQYKVQQTNFMKIGELVESFDKAGQNMQFFEVTLGGLKRRKKGRTTFYTIETAEWDANSPVEMNEAAVKAFNDFRKTIREENKQVMKKHNAAAEAQAKKSESNKGNTDDLDDEIPF